MSSVNSGNNWENLFILAHEVGHHINGHSLDLVLYAAEVVEPESLANQRQNELQADEFAGFILAKLGATLEQTSSAINLMASNSDDTYSTHPSKLKRLLAIEKGFNKAFGVEKWEDNESLERWEEFFYSSLEKYNKGDLYYAIQDLNMAITSLDKKTNPDINITLSLLFYQKGYMRSDYGDNTGAIEDYTMSIVWNPSYEKSYLNRGFLRRKINDNDGAFEDYSAVISIFSSFISSDQSGSLPSGYDIYSVTVDAYYNRSILKSEMGDLYGAIEDCSKAIEIDPSDGRLYAARGVSKAKLKDYYGAIDDLNKAINLDDFDVASYYNRAEAKQKDSDFYGSIFDYTKVIEIVEKQGVFTDDHILGDYYFRRSLSKYFLKDLKGFCKDLIRAYNLGTKRNKITQEMLKLCR
jgi:tetratricopeptide (TPR) repeat protein